MGHTVVQSRALALVRVEIILSVHITLFIPLYPKL